MKHFCFTIFILTLFFLSACKPIVTTDLYIQDLEDAISSKEKITIPITIAIPISSVNECDGNKNEIEKILKPHCLNLQYKQCKKISTEIYDVIEFQMDAQIFNPSLKNDSNEFIHKEWQGLVAFNVYTDYGKIKDNQVVFLQISDNMDTVLKKFEDEFMQHINGFDLKIKIHNDRREDRYILVRNSFLNNYPIDKLEKKKLKKREYAEMVLADARSSRLMLSKFGGLFNFPKNSVAFLSKIPDFVGEN